MPAVVQDGGVWRRDVPKINGSSGAFIAVVVVLVVIIVVSCSAVVYLIHEARRQEGDPRQRYQPAATPSSRGLEVGGTASGTSPSPYAGKVRSVVDRFLSRHQKSSNLSPEGHLKPGKRSGQGWVQAAGSDYEESGDELKRPGHATQMSEVLDISKLPAPLTASATASSNVVAGTLDPRERVSSMVSSDTSMSMDSTFRSSSTALRYPEPFAPSPQRSISNMTSHLLPHSMLSSPASSPPLSLNRLATSSPEPISGADGDDNIPDALRVYPNGRGRSTASQSGVSMRTMDTGSRFVEGL